MDLFISGRCFVMACLTRALWTRSFKVAVLSWPVCHGLSDKAFMDSFIQVPSLPPPFQPQLGRNQLFSHAAGGCATLSSERPESTAQHHTLFTYKGWCKELGS